MPSTPMDAEVMEGDVAALKKGQIKIMEGLEEVLKRCPRPK